MSKFRMIIKSYFIDEDGEEINAHQAFDGDDKEELISRAHREWTEWQKSVVDRRLDYKIKNVI